MAGMANARGGMFSMCPKAAHMETTAYGLHAAKKPMQTATLSLKKRGKGSTEENGVTYIYSKVHSFEKLLSLE